MTLYEQISQEVERYTRPVEIYEGHYFDHRKTIKRINLYQINKFLECDDESAVFWNLAAPHVPHFAKNIDLDTKNFKVFGEGEVNFAQAWIMNLKFQQWAQKNGFALTLNDLSEGAATYGTVVWKLVDDEDGKRIEECNFNTLYYDPLVRNINDSNIIELHELSENEIRNRFPKADIEEVMRRAEKTDKNTEYSKVKVWEFCGYHDGKYAHKILVGAGENEYVLHDFKNASPDKPTYFDFHIHRYKGRHLRIGVYERLFALQERCNALVNQNAETTAIASLLLLRSEDPNVRGNVLNGARSGQIITSRDLQQVPMDNRNIGGFMNEMQMLEAQATKLCLTPEVVTGEALPSHTPFRSVAALTNAAVSAFKNTRDRMGLTVSQILLDHIFPSLVQNWNKGEIIEISGNEEDIRNYDRLIINVRTNNWLKGKLAQGETPSPEETEEYKTKMQEDFDTNGRKLQIEKNFFNFKYGLKMNPTGENYSQEQMNDAYFNAMQMKGTNPMVAQDPMFRQYLERNGITPFRYTQAEMAQMAQGQTAFQPTKSGGKDSLSSMIQGNE